MAKTTGKTPEKTAKGKTKTDPAAPPKTGKSEKAEAIPAKKAGADKTRNSSVPSKTATTGKTVPVKAKPESTKKQKPVSKSTTAEKKSPADTSVKPVEKTSAQPSETDKWKEIRELLKKMKQETLQEISKSIRSGSESAVGEEPTGDIYDQASSERDRELGLILNDREREKVLSIDDALLRMDEGEYGICEECDEEIPLGRLKVLPFTRHCVRCKSDLEKIQAQTKRFEEDRAYREIPVGGDDDEG